MYYKVLLILYQFSLKYNEEDGEGGEVNLTPTPPPEKTTRKSQALLE